MNESPSSAPAPSAPVGRLNSCRAGWLCVFVDGGSMSGLFLPTKHSTTFKALAIEAENPVILGLEARGVWEGHSGRSTIHIGPYELGGEKIDRDTRHYTIPYGAWREVEEAIGFVGPTDRVEPVEMALGAVAACLCNSIALNAPRNGINLEGLEIKVHTDIDPSVLFEVKGPEAHTSCMPKITTEVKVKGAISDEQLKTIERLVHYSPVHGMVEYANKVESRVSRA